jgi:nucleoside-diphosphate-sugar epimerase
MKKKIFITGGAGYVGCSLADSLVEKNYDVTVLDLCLYGENVFRYKSKINLIKGDIRDQELLKKSLPGHYAVIHLACISNDPSFELNPLLGKSINLDAFEPLIKFSKDTGVQRFIYASSSSVYGIKEDTNVTEDVKLEPITDYSKFKANCEDICFKYSSKDFITTIIRPATVCGFSKRQRFDLVINILTNLGINNGQITVFGGNQLRPNIHINDMVNSYINVLEQDDKKVNTKIYNVGYENQTVMELANLVKKNLDKKVEIILSETNDNRSYHISSEKIKNELGFINQYTIEDAIIDIKNAFKRNEFIESLNNDIYFNVKMMKKINLK